SDPELISLVHQAMKDGYNQYAPLAGITPLRVAIANKYEKLYSSSYNPDTEITVTAGATQAIFTIISAFIKPKDEVIIFTPAYDCYEPAIELYGGIVVPIQLKAPEFKVNWELVKSRVSRNTKMVIINSPHNPSGTLLDKEDMSQLEDILRGTNILVLSDEVYEHIVFNGEEHQSVCRFPDLKLRSFAVASFGKTFHNTGWKVGYCCAPKELMDEYKKVHQYNVFSVHHPSQKGLADYIINPETYLQLSKFYERKRDLFLSLIKDSRFSFIPSKGTYFQALDYSAITDKNDVDFATELIKEKKIASIPISVFYRDNLNQKLLRFCFAKKDETLKKGAEILCNI
ncbi:MAG: methionine aminotransferase, partial [Flavobacteriaceae bacterium]|nr:methionine aminotransferase [Flavobacteriaceae bacterium]